MMLYFRQFKMVFATTILMVGILAGLTVTSSKAKQTELNNRKPVSRDNDKNVDWRQGIEYYNAARRAGKQMVLLVYANEGHGLRQDKNRIDYHRRILQWFGHYLKGEPTKQWIDKGIPYQEQQRRLNNLNKK